MAILLNLETATTNCSVSIAKDGQLLALKELNNQSYSHSEQLHNFILEVLEQAGITTAQLDAIAVSKGPGSYTGLRIGVSAAKGLCFSLDVPLIAVSTLQSMSRQLQVVSQDVIIPVLDARRLEVYAAVFSSEYEPLTATTAQIVTMDSFKEWVKDRSVHLIGSGAEKCRDILKHPDFHFYPEVVPSAREMCSLSYKMFVSGHFEDVAYFEPYYLKDFILTTKQV